MAGGVYNLDRLISDACSQAGKCPGSRAGLVSASSISGVTSSRQLSEVWAALDRYASNCLEEKRGLVIPNFCKIGWHMRELRGKMTYRPYFQLLDCFCRNFGADATSVRHGPPPPERDLCSFEEFNFSKAAIKFSGELTKDQVSGSLRQLVRQIGEAVSTHHALDIELSFGKFRSKEKDVSFVFAAHFYCAHGLEVPTNAVDDVQYKPPEQNPAFGRVPTADTLRSISLKGSGRGRVQAAPQKDMSGKGGERRGSTFSAASTMPSSRASSVDASGGKPAPAARPDSGAGGGWEYSSAGGADLLRLTQEATRTFLNPDGFSATWDASSWAGGNEGYNAPAWAPPRMPTARAETYSSAREEAVNREISCLEKRASEALRDRAEEDAKAVKAARADARADEVKRAALQQHYAVLKRQIDAKEAAKDRLQRARAAESAEPDFPHSTPSTASGRGMSARRYTASDEGREHLAPPVFAEELVRPSTSSRASSSSRGRQAAGMTSGLGGPRSSAKPPPLAVQVAARAAQARAEEEAAKNGVAVGPTELSMEKDKKEQKALMLKKDLDQQVQAKQQRQDRVRDYEKRLEAKLLEGQVAEEEIQREFERAAKLKERQELSAAWREESKIKDIRKSIEAVEQGRAMPRPCSSNGYSDHGRLPSARSSALATPRSGSVFSGAASLTLGACLTGRA